MTIRTALPTLLGLSVMAVLTATVHPEAGLRGLTFERTSTVSRLPQGRGAFVPKTFPSAAAAFAGDVSTPATAARASRPGPRGPSRDAIQTPADPRLQLARARHGFGRSQQD